MSDPMYTPKATTAQQFSSRASVSPTMKAHCGTVRAAALAARRAHQFKQRKLNNSAIAASGIKLLHLQPDDESDGLRSPSPVESSNGHTPLHIKKKLNLRLDLGGARPPPLPLMMQSPIVVDAAPVEALELNEPSLTESSAGGAQLYPMNCQVSDRRRSSYFKNINGDERRRRKSSVTLNMNSPEAAEFHEVAHDGPAELGHQTKRIKKLGRGAGGVVYLGVYVPTLKLVAIKDVTVYKDAERRMVQHELHALHANVSTLHTAPNKDISKHCPFLVGFYGAYLRPSKGAVSIVMEFMDFGSMQDLLDRQHTITEDVLRHAAYCCFSALQHMHSQRMVHRDIKPANILLNRHGDFKIADFGLAGTLAQSDSFFSEFEGTIMYMAPERISGESYGCVSDVWSLGVALFYLATGVYPFAVDDGFFGLEEAICTDPLPPMPNRFSPTCRDFMKGVLRRAQAERMTANEALLHPFLRNYWGSSQHKEFKVTWESFGLKGALSAEDMSTLVEVIVDHSERYPGTVNLQTTVAQQTEKVREINSSPRAFFAQMSRMFAGKKQPLVMASETSTRPIDYIEELASDLGVLPAQLQEKINQALREMQRH